MSKDAFGKDLLDTIAKQKGFSRSKVYKILSLQRLTPEVAQLGEEGRIVESALVEISRIENATRQKHLAELVVENGLTVSDTRLLGRLIRAAEGARGEAWNQIWDFYFSVHEAVERNRGMTDELRKRAKDYLKELPTEEGDDDVEELDADALLSGDDEVAEEPATAVPAPPPAPEPVPQPEPQPESEPEPEVVQAPPEPPAAPTPQPSPSTTLEPTVEETINFEKVDTQTRKKLEERRYSEPSLKPVEAKYTGEESDPFFDELMGDTGFPEDVTMLKGSGLDVGTTNLCAARQSNSDPKVYFNLQRNAFIDVRTDPYTRKMLMKLGIDHIRLDDRMYVLGSPAFELANIFERNTRRPMKDGLISPHEEEALEIVSLLMAHVLGDPREDGEIVCFSVPADPIDMDRNVIYHSGSLDVALRKLGYKPRPVIEGHSVVLAEMHKEGYTGIGISCGGGMFNVCVSYAGVPALTFSTSRGGDWIDNNVADALDVQASHVASIKESGVDLASPSGRMEEAIVIYYRNLINYTLTMIMKKFRNADEMPTFSRPVPIVTAGGTSMIPGFIDVFREEFEKVSFPIDISEIRMARDPLHTVSHGCLVAALQERYPPEELAALQTHDGAASMRDSKSSAGKAQKVEVKSGDAGPKAEKVKKPAALPKAELDDEFDIDFEGLDLDDLGLDDIPAEPANDEPSELTADVSKAMPKSEKSGSAKPTKLPPVVSSLPPVQDDEPLEDDLQEDSMNDDLNLPVDDPKEEDQPSTEPEDKDDDKPRGDIDIPLIS